MLRYATIKMTDLMDVVGIPVYKVEKEGLVPSNETARKEVEAENRENEND